METTEYEIGSRKLVFEGFTLKGRSDLTSLGKATGEALWPCSLLLAYYLVAELSTAPRPLKVLELGCGLGLCGTVASVALGAGSEVLLTDGDASVLDRAKLASRANIKPTDATTSHQLLRWGDNTATELLRQERGCFDWIIASDILYEADHAYETAGLFASTVDALLAAGPFSRCLVSFQKRGVPVDVLVEAMVRRGLDEMPINGDVYEDLFDERHDEPTMTTIRFLLCFQRSIEGKKSAR